MKKRLVSFLLALSMVLTFLPVGAVSAFAEESTEGELLVGDGKIDITNAFIQEHGTTTYQMKGPYSAPVEVTADCEVTINITGTITYTGLKKDYSAFNFVVVANNPNGNVIVNNSKNYRIAVSDESRGIVYVKPNGHAEVIGGDYASEGYNPKTPFYNWQGTLTLTDVSASGAVVLQNNKGKTTINGGTYKRVSTDTYNVAKAAIYNETGGTVELNNVEVYAENGNAVVNSYGAMTINGGKFSSADENESAILADTSVQEDWESSNVTDPSIMDITITGATIKNSAQGIEVKNGNVTLNSATFEKNKNDIVLDADQTITIADTFKNSATVLVTDEELSLPREITTPGNAQKNLKLTSNNEGYLIGYHDNGDGTGYRELVEHTGYLVNVEDGTATAEIDGKAVVLDNLTQVPKGTKVTVKANDAQEGMRFDQWTVSPAGLLGDTSFDWKADTITFEMPDHDLIFTAQYTSAEIEDDTSSILGTAAIVGTTIVGGAVLAYQMHELGTEFWLNYHLPVWAAIPENRIQLAEVMWKDAGQPEPVSAALYSDIDANDTEAQQAAQWAIENELMSLPNTDKPTEFDPYAAVSHVDAIHAWKKYEQMKK